MVPKAVPARLSLAPGQKVDCLASLEKIGKSGSNGPENHATIALVAQKPLYSAWLLTSRVCHHNFPEFSRTLHCVLQAILPCRFFQNGHKNLVLQIILESS